VKEGVAQRKDGKSGMERRKNAKGRREEELR